MIDKQFFKDHQKVLLKIINNPVGRWLFGVHRMGHREAKGKKILEVFPNAIKFEVEDGYRYQFFNRPEYAIKVGKVCFWMGLTDKGKSFGRLVLERAVPAIAGALAGLPVAIILTTDFNSNAGGDGTITYDGSYRTWATGRALSAGDNTYASTASYYVAIIHAGNSGQNLWQIFRAFLPFDTSTLDDSATISAATMSVCKSTVDTYYDVNDSYAYVSVVQSTQASDTALVNGDFDQLGATEGSDQRLYSGMTSNNTYYAWTLNSTGISWISKTGYTKLGLRDGHDITNNAPTNSLNIWRGNRFYFNFSDSSSNKPVLALTIQSGPANVKTVNGLAIASVKTVNGLAISSVKSVNGLT